MFYHLYLDKYELENKWEEVMNNYSKKLGRITDLFVPDP